jgi:daunorubicin/doxorubicin transport system ATP-binding protein
MPARTTATPPGPAVEAAALTKTFGAARALDGLDLAIPRGGVYGLLGPNGAGKTTAIRILTTLLRPDAGSARVLGHDVLREPAAVRRRVSLTGQFASLDDELTAVENLVLLARLLGHSRRQARARCDELLHAFGLAGAGDRVAGQLSGGLRRRLDIAASIIVTPDLLFLDEPTTGLDPRSRNQVWDLVRALGAAGTTVVLTTQYLDEADQLAERIAVIDHGRVIAEGTRGELKASVGAGGVHLRLLDATQRPDAERLLARELGVPVHREPDSAALAAQLPAHDAALDTATLVGHALDQLCRAGIAVTDFSLGQPTLDEVFLALTGSPAHSANRVTNGEEATT